MVQGEGRKEGRGAMRRGGKIESENLQSHDAHVVVALEKSS